MTHSIKRNSNFKVKYFKPEALSHFGKQASTVISIPKEHHRFILGKNVKKLQDLEKNTATRIHFPQSEENSDSVKITGSKDGIERARHELQLISDEQVLNKLAF